MSTLDPRRDFDVTASDVPTICGECRYSNRRAVLFKKSLKLRSVDTEATLHGRHYEPTAISKFCEKTGAKVELSGKDSEYKKHSVYSWLGGTVDGIATFPDGKRMILEVKCPLTRSIKDGAIPIHYIGQVQTYMFIYDMDCCVFVQYRPAGVRRPEQLQITYITRDPKYMALRLPRLKVFWDEMIMWTAYTERVITIIQRAWRFYRARRALQGAAKNSMTARLRCAKMIGKMAGFCKTKEVQRAVLVPPILETTTTVYVIESEDSPIPKSKRSRIGLPRGTYMIE